MKVGDLIKHITQDKWGIVLEVVDYSEYITFDASLYCNVVWGDEERPFWVWDDIIKVVDCASR